MTHKILLMTPPYHTGIIEITGKWPPLNLLYLAGALRQFNYQIDIYDAMTKNHTLTEIEAYIRSSSPQIIITGAYTSSINAALETLALVKKINPDIITILGGVHATFCFEEILRQHHDIVDFIVLGEGEVTVCELLEAIKNNLDLGLIKGIAYRQKGCIQRTADREQIADLDSLKPAWDLLDWSDYRYRVTDRRLALVSSSRGCNHQCRFCSQHKFWRGTYRQRSPENLVAELEYLNKTHQVEMSMFSDEYATLDRKRWEKILDLLIEKNLGMHFSIETRAEDIIRDQDILWKYKKAGFMHVYVGVESTRQADLNLYKKNLSIDKGRQAIQLLNQAGILTECSFILGTPDETPESIEIVLQQALDYNPDLAHFLLITPWPYSDIYEDLKPYIVEYDYSKYHFVYPIVKPKKMTTHQLMQKVYYCFKVFYQHKAQEYLAAPESFKKTYMLRSIELMYKEFFHQNFVMKDTAAHMLHGSK